jgi:hypothetical protein
MDINTRLYNLIFDEIVFFNIVFITYKLNTCKAKKDGSGLNVLAPLPMLIKSSELFSLDEIKISSINPLVKK